MADFFKSAFNYIGGSGVSQDNDFVGQYVELGNQKLRVKRVIAEGWFIFRTLAILRYLIIYMRYRLHEMKWLHKSAKFVVAFYQ